MYVDKLGETGKTSVPFFQHQIWEQGNKNKT